MTDACADILLHAWQDGGSSMSWQDTLEARTDDPQGVSATAMHKRYL